MAFCLWRSDYGVLFSGGFFSPFLSDTVGG